LKKEANSAALLNLSSSYKFMLSKMLVVTVAPYWVFPCGFGRKGPTPFGPAVDTRACALQLCRSVVRHAHCPLQGFTPCRSFGRLLVMAL